MRKKVFTAMSGGVDSSVAAALLKKRGFDVRGVHIKMWSDPDIPCISKEDRHDAMAVAAHLGIPFETWDLTEDYKRAVVEYMIREYAAGRTPNPDIMCNREIKFGVFLRRALARAADFVTTGHYVRAVPSPFRYSDTLTRSSGALAEGRTEKGGDRATPSSHCLNNKTARPSVESNLSTHFKLLMGRDDNKDQSYFLWTLTQNQLKRCLFPIGEYAKPEVREMARSFGLPTAEKKDSQGICFIGEIDVREFLKKYIQPRRGEVLTTSGARVGEHDGVEFYTIGQRHGIGAAGGGIPYYVAAKDFASNTLTVAEGPYDERLFSRKLVAGNMNWISGAAPEFPLQCEARIRYRQPLQKCIVQPTTNNQQSTAASLKVSFSEAQRAVTPGQSIVFYRGEEMIGGGVIQEKTAD